MQQPLNSAFETSFGKPTGKRISPIYFRSPERRGLTLSSCVVRIRIRAQYSISAEETSYDNRDYTTRTDRNRRPIVNDYETERGSGASVARNGDRHHRHASRPPRHGGRHHGCEAR